MASISGFWERLLIGSSISILPLIFFGELVLALYMLISNNFKFIIEFIVIGFVVVWMQFSICIIFYQENYKRWILYFKPSYNELQAVDKNAKLNSILWVVSLNPIFPVISKYFKFLIPLIEVCYFMYVILFSFYWKRNHYLALQLSHEDYIAALLFVIASWALLGFPFTGILFGLLSMLILSIPAALIITFCMKENLQ